MSIFTFLIPENNDIIVSNYDFYAFTYYRGDPLTIKMARIYKKQITLYEQGENNVLRKYATQREIQRTNFKFNKEEYDAYESCVATYNNMSIQDRSNLKAKMPVIEDFPNALRHTSTIEDVDEFSVLISSSTRLQLKKFIYNDNQLTYWLKLLICDDRHPFNNCMIELHRRDTIEKMLSNVTFSKESDVVINVH